MQEFVRLRRMPHAAPDGRMMASMNATHLRAVHTLDGADTLQLGNDPRFFRVVAVERTSADPDARFRVTLRGTLDAAAVTLVRGGREMVLAMDPAVRRIA
jgi:hypothetical protein